jgi:hypothetical protein
VTGVHHRHPSPFTCLYLVFLSFLYLVVAFHAGFKVGMAIGALLLLVILCGCVWCWVYVALSAEEYTAPKHKSSQSENGHPKNHQDGSLSTTQESILLPGPPLSPDHITVPVNSHEHTQAEDPVESHEHRPVKDPVAADAVEDAYTNQRGLPLPLLTVSASTSSVPSGNQRTSSNRPVTASHGLSELDSLGNLSTIEPSARSLALFDPVQFLTQQLDVMHKQGILLRERYTVLGSSEQRSGSQGVVRFANLAVNPLKQFAVKFFIDRRNFEIEKGWYEDSSLRDFLPPPDDVRSNESEPHVLGRALPPMIVTERGESLDEWTRRCKPDFYMCISIVGHLVERVRKIHGAGLVHRDLKPSNVMWLPSVNGFTVIDFGSTARAGAEASISCTMPYAAPEAVDVIAKGETRILVTSALDVWSLGVIFYEFLTGLRVFACSRDDIIAAASGQALLPWEEQDTPQHRTHMRRLGFLRELILAMLDRDPVRRITMTEVHSGLKELVKREATM